MGATRFFIFSTFLVLMFGFALSLPTAGYEVSGEGLSRMIRALGPASNGTPEDLLTRFRRSPIEVEDDEVGDRAESCLWVYKYECKTVGGRRKCKRVRECDRMCIGCV